MTATLERSASRAIGPLHAVLLAGTVPLFLGALLGDAAYASTYHVQWSDFASWLIVGGLLFAGLALVLAIVDFFRADRRGVGLAYLMVLLATWMVGFLDALMHARDAWASMPTGLVLSAVAALLACVATWMGFRAPRIGVTP